MAMSAKDYQRAGLNLLPIGKAWPRHENSTQANLMLGTGQEFARVDTINDQLLREMHPDQAFMLLDDWEDFAGLPDCSIDKTDLISLRRQALTAKLTMTPSLCNKFYEYLANTRGYKVSIVEHYPHHCLRDCTYPLYPEINWFRVFVHIHEIEARFFTVIDNVTQYLRVTDAYELECLFERYAPAETEFVFIYENEKNEV